MVLKFLMNFGMPLSPKYSGMVFQIQQSCHASLNSYLSNCRVDPAKGEGQGHKKSFLVPYKPYKEKILNNLEKIMNEIIIQKKFQFFESID